MPNEPVNLAAKFASFSEHWSPKVVGKLNGQLVKVVKLKGEYVWHHHADEDELFWVISGEMDIHLRDRVITLHAGEFFIVPRGVEHKPVAKHETHVVLFEPASVRNTGNVAGHQFTIEPENLEQI